jgi:hypothetical protein
MPACRLPPAACRLEDESVKLSFAHYQGYGKVSLVPSYPPQNRAIAVPPKTQGIPTTWKLRQAKAEDDVGSA